MTSRFSAKVLSKSLVVESFAFNRAGMNPCIVKSIGKQSLFPPANVAWALKPPPLRAKATFLRFCNCLASQLNEANRS